MKFPPWWGYGYFLELHNVDFVRFHDKNAVFKFIRLSVDRRPIWRSCCVFKFIQLGVDVASVEILL